VGLWVQLLASLLAYCKAHNLVAWTAVLEQLEKGAAFLGQSSRLVQCMLYVV